MDEKIQNNSLNKPCVPCAIALIAVISALACKRGERVYSALY